MRNAPWQEFHHWVHDNVVTGIRFSGSNIEHVKYVPVSLLRDYWNEDNRIQDLWMWRKTGSDPTMVNPTPAEIMESYIRIFSTLVYIHQVDHDIPTTTGNGLTVDAPTSRDVPTIRKENTAQYITKFYSYLDSNKNLSNFTDNNLWLNPSQESASRIFNTITSGGKRICQAFCDNQYIFNHVNFEPKSPRQYRLNKHMILPLIDDNNNPIPSIGGGTAKVKVYKVQQGSGFTSVEKIVLKEYPKWELKSSFKNERRAYDTLTKLRDDSYFLRYFGDFQQDGKGVLLLEYADQGSLEDFFKTTHPPWNFDELYSFWSSLSKVILGVQLLYPFGDDTDKIGRAKAVSKRRSKTVNQIHQDLKPANIFVFKGPADKQFSYHFKIGDLGSSSVKIRNLTDDQGAHAAHEDHMSTRMYNAPELQDCDGVTSEADVWSLGCVLLEAAVWAVCGYRGLDAFFDKRMEETPDAKEDMGAFHKGGIELKAIEDMTDTILKSRRVSDNLTEGLVKIIMKNMLVIEPKDRKKLGKTFKDFKDHLKFTKDEHDAPPKSAPAGMNPGHSESTALTPPRWKGKQIEPNHSDHNNGSQPAFSPRPPSMGESSSSSWARLEQQPTPTPPQQSTHSIHSVTNTSRPVNPSENTTRNGKELEHNNSYNGIQQPTLSLGAPSVSESSRTGISEDRSSGRLQHERQPTPTLPRQSTPLIHSVANTSRSSFPGNQMAPTPNAPPELRRAENSNESDKVTLVQIMDFWKEQSSISAHDVKTPPGPTADDSKIGKDQKQIIIVDDSRPIRSSKDVYWAQVHGVFTAIVCFIRPLYPEKEKEIGLYFTSQQPPKCISNRKAKALIGEVDDKLKSRSRGNTSEKGLARIFMGKLKTTATPEGATATSEKSLAKIVSEIEGRVPGGAVRIYVLTDGVSGQGVGSDREGLMEALKSLKSAVPRVSVSVRVVLFPPPKGQNGLGPDFVQMMENGNPQGLEITVKDYNMEDTWGMIL